jgi:hypothetical protein
MPRPDTASSTDSPITSRQTKQAKRKQLRRGIFLSYRRSDAMSASGRIYEHLSDRYGKRHVFKDVDSLLGGDDFAKMIAQTIPQSAVALVIIGQAWADARDEAGQRRLDDPEDLVRREVEAAFADEVPVVPVLVEGARMPEAEQLPPRLQRLPALNAVMVNHDPDFEMGVRRLIKAVDPLLPPAMRPQVRRRRAALSVLGVLGLVALLAAGLARLAFPASEPYGGAATQQDTIRQVVEVSNGASTEAWAVGYNKVSGGFILHEHGGRWAKVYPLGLAARRPIPHLYALAMTSPSEGWAVGAEGTLLHLTGGVWVSVATLTREDLNGVALSASGSEGWAVGDDGTLLHLAPPEWRVVNGPAAAT